VRDILGQRERAGGEGHRIRPVNKAIMIAGCVAATGCAELLVAFIGAAFGALLHALLAPQISACGTLMLWCKQYNN
jgi:hypothetical protein